MHLTHVCSRIRPCLYLNVMHLETVFPNMSLFVSTCDALNTHVCSRIRPCLYLNVMHLETRVSPNMSLFVSTCDAPRNTCVHEYVLVCMYISLFVCTCDALTLKGCNHLACSFFLVRCFLISSMCLNFVFRP